MRFEAFREKVALRLAPWLQDWNDSEAILEENIYITGEGQVLGNIHDRSACLGRACVIHDPSDHSMRDFPTYFRSDRGIMERICPHGIGHPDPDDAAWHASKGRDIGVHGCDGCCRG